MKKFTLSQLSNKKAFIALLFIVSFFSFNTAEALTLTPVRFELRGDPGETITETITLINENTAQEVYYTSFSNFQAEGESGTPVFVENNEAPSTWMSAPNVVTVTPNSEKSVNLSIKIPETAEPGGYFGAVFFGTTPSQSEGGQVSIGAKIGVLVLLSVNGDVEEAGGLLNFNTKDNKFFYNTLPVDFEYRFRNDGADRIKPLGIAKIRNTFFIPTDKLNANPVEGNILPDSTRKFNFSWHKYEDDPLYVPSGSISHFFHTAGYQWKNFAVGLYSAKLDLSYGLQDLKVKDSVYFFVFPWQLLIVLLVIALVVFFGGRLALRKYNSYIISKARANNI